MAKKSKKLIELEAWSDAVNKLHQRLYFGNDWGNVQ